MRAAPDAAVSRATGPWYGGRRRPRGIRGRPLPVPDPHPRAADLFVGRGEDLERLEALLFPSVGTRRPVVVSGMAGVGKSYFVDRFYWDHQDKFPGGYLRLSLDPEKLVPASELIVQLADRLKLPVGGTEALRTRLLAAPGLVHIENADTPRGRPRCRRVVRRLARMRGRHQRAISSGWALAPVGRSRSNSDHLTRRSRCANSGPNSATMRRVGETGPPLSLRSVFCPLALHLAAGYLWEGDSAAGFLDRLRRHGFSLEHVNPGDDIYQQRSRALISDTFELSLAALTRSGGEQGTAWRAGFAALGHAPSAGFGASLGAALAGLDADAFDDMVSQARRLSLLDRVARGAGAAWRLHPLLAELVRSGADRDAVFGRMTEWFVMRLPAGGGDQGERWSELHDESAALTEWLGQVPEGERVRIERAGSRYAVRSGPYHAWVRFCEEMLAGSLDDAEQSNVLWTLGNVALWGGLPERAEDAANEKRALDQNRGEEREAAFASGLIADILQMRGDLDGALRIRREEELPVYERLGDISAAAVTKGADRRHSADAGRSRRGAADQARGAIAGLRAARRRARGGGDEGEDRRHSADAGRSRRGAADQARGGIAGLRAARRRALGGVDQGEDRRHFRGGAISTGAAERREELLPDFERLGDARSAAVTKGQIADILQSGAISTGRCGSGARSNCQSTSGSERARY